MMPARSAAFQSSFTASLHGTQISPKVHLHHSSETVRSPSGPLTHKRLQCSDYTTPTSSSSVGPSRKRSRGTSTMHLDESGDEGNPKTHKESDVDSDVWADIEAKTAAAAMTAAAVDGLD
ncbi:hypothetical protein Tco_0325246, partial [Tanacetum coccineum]